MTTRTWTTLNLTPAYYLALWTLEITSKHWILKVYSCVLWLVLVTVILRHRASWGRKYPFYSFRKFDPILNHQLITICRRVKRVRFKLDEGLDEGSSCKNLTLNIPILFSFDQVRKAVLFPDDIDLKLHFLSINDVTIGKYFMYDIFLFRPIFFSNK